MKKAVEYLKELFEEPFDLSGNSIESDFLNVIKQAQEDVIKETAREFKILSELKYYTGESGYLGKEDVKTLTDKLIKEL